MFTKTIDIDDVEFEVQFSYIPLKPAKTYGPPENCHPAEGGEVEIESITIGDYDLLGFLSEKVENRIQQICEEAAPEMHREQIESDLCDMADSYENL